MCVCTCMCVCVCVCVCACACVCASVFRINPVRLFSPLKLPIQLDGITAAVRTYVDVMM